MRYQAVSGAGYIVHDANHGVSFEIIENPRELSNMKAPTSQLEWDSAFQTLGDLRIFPYGANNRLPSEIRDIVKNNNEAPGMLKKKAQLLWGKGPKLYVEKLVDGMPVIEWVEDAEIMAWLKSWDYRKYLMQVLVDYSHIEAFFTKYIPSRDSLLGRPFINRLEHMSIDKSRLATSNPELNSEPTHAVYSTRPFGTHMNYQVDWFDYPLFDFKNPQSTRTVEYSSMCTFAQDIYAVPDIYGALGWLRQSNNIPKLFDALSKNGISAKYHVQSPQAYWDKKRELLQERCDLDPDKTYDEKMLDDYKEELLRGIGEVLSGIENVGKFWHSEVFYDDDMGSLKELGWKIEPINQNIKEFVEAQIKISERAAYAISTAFNISPVLANVDSNNRANSGSAQIYALNNYMATGVDMDELVVCGPINKAIALNFPDKQARLGFYYVTQKREEDVTPSQRAANLNE